MNDKDLFLNYHKQLESDDFDNQFFKRIYSVLEDFTKMTIQLAI